jgi:hypothetical protein
MQQSWKADYICKNTVSSGTKSTVASLLQGRFCADAGQEAEGRVDLAATMPSRSALLGGLWRARKRHRAARLPLFNPPMT